MQNKQETINPTVTYEFLSITFLCQIKNQKSILRVQIIICYIIYTNFTF